MRRAATLGAAALALALAACTPDSAGSVSPTATSPAAPSPQSPAPPPEITVPHQSLAGEVEMRVAENVTPPTSRWYSSIAFGEPGNPVFPKPLSFKPVDGGFIMGLTHPSASENTIASPASSDLTVTVAEATGYGTVTRANPIGADLAWDDATVTIAQGWPVVGVTASGPVSLSTSVAFEDNGDGVGTASGAGGTYGVAVTGGDIEGQSIVLDEGGSAQFFAVPDGGSVEAFAAALGEPVRAVTWQGVATEASATTTLTYGERTVVTMPTARARDAGLDCSLGTYATIEGTYAVCAGGTVEWSVPAVTPSAGLAVARLSDVERREIGEALAADVAALEPPGADSYFGGKHLARIANLYSIAVALGDENSAATLKDVLWENLEQWGDATRCESGEPKCFVYDPNLRGIVGVTPSFGSEEFNDHHFHYGYLLYAAAVAAAADPELAEQIGPVFDQVAADIASGADSETFPAIRVFDPVAGHSWAGGLSPFADGNNQESSSEAVSAWNGLALWAQVRGDSGLEERARWLLAAEADAARRLWLEPDLAEFPAFGHDIVAIEWGAKRDYATWFSAEPAAMLGIQLIPMAPFADQYLGAVDPGIAKESIAAATGGGYGVMFGDYILMYAATTGIVAPSVAWKEALELPESSIDDGDSRTYLLAYIAELD